MPTARMTKFKIAVKREEQKNVLELLTQSGNFEICEAERAMPDTFVSPVDTDAIKVKQAKVSLAIDYIKGLFDKVKETNKKIKKSAKDSDIEAPALLAVDKTAKSSIRQNLSKDDAVTIKRNDSALLAACVELEKINSNKLAIEQKIQELKDENELVAPFSGVTVPFNRFADTDTVSVLLAAGPGNIEKIVFERLDCYVEEFPVANGVLWGILCKKADKATIARKLNTLGFVLCVYEYPLTAVALIEKNEHEVQALELRLKENFADGLAYQSRLTELKALYDVYGLELEHAEVARNFYYTDDTVIIEGWVPAALANSIKDKLDKTVAGIEVQYRDVEKSDEPPTLMSNRGLFRPFEGITKGYAAPRYGELDPSAAMSIFFFIFFGMMLADAGYGLILAVVGLGIGLGIKRLQTPMRRMIVMFGICGISGIVFGLLFGGVFAISPIAENHYLLFNPMNEPVLMLALAIGLGVVHLLTAYTIKTIVSVKLNVTKSMSKGAKVRAILDALFYSLWMYTLFAGILLLIAPMLSLEFLSESDFPFAAIGMALLITTFAGILLTNGRNAKSMGGRIAGGLGGLYRLVNVFSDVLSYARLFGLALASGAIALAFNQIGALLFGLPIVGYLIGGIILLLLHSINFALAALGGYVHSIRLTYVEFFGKFYDGSGRFFEPLGEKTQYVKFV